MESNLFLETHQFENISKPFFMKLTTLRVVIPSAALIIPVRSLIFISLSLKLKIPYPSKPKFVTEIMEIHHTSMCNEIGWVIDFVFADFHVVKFFRETSLIIAVPNRWLRSLSFTNLWIWTLITFGNIFEMTKEQVTIKNATMMQKSWSDYFGFSYSVLYLHFSGLHKK